MKLPVDLKGQSAPPVAWRMRLTALLFCLGCCTGALAQDLASICGNLSNPYGPYDYRTQRNKLAIVESFHFSPNVEYLRRGDTGALGGDLDYTLRASPNHHRALMALVRLAQKTGQTQPASLPRPIDCYFERALRFRNDDVVARMIFVQHLINTRREPEARQQLAASIRFAGNNGFSHYNIGLLYAELKDWDAALGQVHKALALDFTRIDPLRNRLRDAGHWREPAPADGSAAQPASQAMPPAAAGSSAGVSPDTEGAR